MIAVTGATGNVGRELVRILTEAGEEVRAVSRRPTRLPGVRHRAADLADPPSLREAFHGAERLFLLVAGDDPAGVLKMAEEGGVRHVVLLSSQGAGTRPELYEHPAAFERSVRASGLTWTILRPGGFHSNAYAWAGSIRADRTVAAPFADVALPSVDPADVAGVAASVLAEPGHEGRTYELTGPAAITPRERVAALGEALGVELRFVEQTREEARAQMLRFMPEPVVDGTLGILGEPTPGEQRVGPAVGEILGRPPRTFADWAAGAVAAFR